MQVLVSGAALIISLINGYIESSQHLGHARLGTQLQGRFQVSYLLNWLVRCDKGTAPDLKVAFKHIENFLWIKGIKKTTKSTKILVLQP